MEKIGLRVAQACSVVVLFLFLAFKAACGCSTKEDAYRAAIKADLRMMAEAEQQFRERHGYYAKTLEDLAFSPSLGVTLTVEPATNGSLVVTGEHRGTAWTCTIALESWGDAASQNRVTGPDCPR
jgi:hypothetical protein